MNDNVKLLLSDKPIQGQQLRIRSVDGKVLSFRVEDVGLTIEYDGSEWWLQKFDMLDDIIEDLLAVKEIIP